MSFTRLDLLTDSTDPDETLQRFNDDLDLVANLHRFLVTSVPRMFEAEIAEVARGADLEHYDYGDAIWDAEKTLGVTPWDVEAHSGMIAISRAVSLSELALAQMAARLFEHPEAIVYRDRRTWSRRLEGLFYKTCLVTPFKVGGNGFSALRDLRDTYVHGYGLASSRERRNELAQRLYQGTDTSPITPEETELGYDGVVGFFGAATYTKGDLHPGIDGRLTASITALATHRAIKQIRSHIASAHAAIEQGVKPGQTSANNKFCRELARRIALDEG